MSVKWGEIGRVKEAETSFLKLKVGDEVLFYRNSGDELSGKNTKGKVVSLVSQHDIFAKENVVRVTIVFFDEERNEVIYKKRFLRAKNGRSASFLEGSPVNKLSVELL